MPQLDIIENFADNNVLTQAQLHAAFLSIENFLNLTKLDDENLQSGSINTGLLAAESVTTEKMAPSSVLLSKLATEVIARLNPAGAIQAYGGDVIPNGYLLCDGSPVSRTTFAALFGAIGTKHGNGDGSTTFNLPDYRGRFLRGRDGGAGRDPDASSRTAMATGGSTGDAVGSVQVDATDVNGLGISDPGHRHSFTNNLGNFGGFGIIPDNGTQHGDLTNFATTGVSIISSDTETRPINANVNWIIKT